MKQCAVKALHVVGSFYAAHDTIIGGLNLDVVVFGICCSFALNRTLRFSCHSPHLNIQPTQQDSSALCPQQRLTSSESLRREKKRRKRKKGKKNGTFRTPRPLPIAWQEACEHLLSQDITPKHRPFLLASPH
jgi:hypothetical protein